MFEESLRKMRRFPLMRPPSVSTMSKICKAFEAEDIHADEAWDMLPLFYLVVKGDAYSYCASETFDDAGIVFGSQSMRISLGFCQGDWLQKRLRLSCTVFISRSIIPFSIGRRYYEFRWIVNRVV